MRIRIQPGELFHIRLDANPTTGYLWEPRLPAGIHLVERTMVPGAAVGAGGQEHFTFRVDTPGEFTVIMALRRPWESRDLETRAYSVVSS